jgi:hypothetical protein
MPAALPVLAPQSWFRGWGSAGPGAGAGGHRASRASVTANDAHVEQRRAHRLRHLAEVSGVFLRPAPGDRAALDVAGDRRAPDRWISMNTSTA